MKTMKKCFLLIMFALIAGVATETQAQVGVRVGANYTGFSGSDAADFDRSWGYHGGLIFNIPVVENFFSVQPEVLYSRKGAASDAITYRVPFIDIPVLAKVNAGPIYFEAGPQASFRVGGVITTDNTPGINTNIDAIRRTSLGYAAGLGFNATPAVSVGVRYNGMLSDFYNADSPDYRNFRSDVFLLTVGFLFAGR